jgi:hypothetical protein
MGRVEIRAHLLGGGPRLGIYTKFSAERRSVGREVHVDCEGFTEQENTLSKHFAISGPMAYLIFNARFATLGGMKIKSVTPRHYRVIMLAAGRGWAPAAR